MAPTLTDSEGNIDLDWYAEFTEAEFAAMPAEQRNEILDELRRREETLEARAEERRNGGFFLPTHLREGIWV